MQRAQGQQHSIKLTNFNKEIIYIYIIRVKMIVIRYILDFKSKIQFQYINKTHN